MIESIFSYVFGDGDPNRGLEDEQLRRAAQVIRESGGAVAAEGGAAVADVEDWFRHQSVAVAERAARDGWRWRRRDGRLGLEAGPEERDGRSERLG